MTSILYLDSDREESAIIPILKRDFAIRSVRLAAGVPLARPDSERVNVVVKSRALETAASLLAAAPGGIETLSVMAPPPARADGSLDPALSHALQQLKIPTMLLFGTRDAESPPRLGRLYRRILPQARLMFVFDATADMDNERPDAVAAILREFMRAKDRFVVTDKSGRLYP